MLIPLFASYVAKKRINRFVSNFQEHVRPRRGSVVYCVLAGYAEHTGIYIGDNTIVHLSGNGNIEEVSPKEFIARINGLNLAINIYVSCDGDEPVGSRNVADRAMEMVNDYRDYNLVFDNCHQFTSGCLNGNFENAHNFFWMVRDETFKVLGADGWRVWDR